MNDPKEIAARVRGWVNSDREFVHRHWTLDVADTLDRLIAENAALRQTLHDELDGNLRLRGLGGARPDEPMSTFLERVFKERDESRAALAAGGGDAVAWVDAKAVEWIASPDRSPQASILTNLYRSKIGDDLAAIYTRPAPPAPAIPAGFVLVPVEPTDAMVQAAHDALESYPLEGNIRRHYRAMLAAAQKEAGNGSST